MIQSDNVPQTSTVCVFRSLDALASHSNVCGWFVLPFDSEGQVLGHNSEHNSMEVSESVSLFCRTIIKAGKLGLQELSIVEKREMFLLQNVLFSFKPQFSITL